MLIVKGNVYTGRGPIPVEQLQEGDLLVDRGHRARRLLKIERQLTARTMTFARNKAVVLSADAILLTAYGERAVAAGNVRQADALHMVLPNYRVVQDRIVLLDDAAEGYLLTVENGENIFVDDYCIKL